MFITTEKGSAIPLANIAFVKPADQGSIIVLKTGQSVKDPRDAAGVFEEAHSQQPQDFNALVASVFKELESLRDRVKSSCYAAEEEMEGALCDLRTGVKTSSKLLTEATLRLDSNSSSLSEAVSNISSETKVLKKTANDLREVVYAAI